MRKEALVYKAVRSALRSSQTTDDTAKTVFERCVSSLDMVALNIWHRQVFNADIKKLALHDDKPTPFDFDATVETISFDKGGDNTLDFVTAASNLGSATCYIERKTRWEVKGALSRILSFTHCWRMHRNGGQYHPCHRHDQCHHLEPPRP